MSVGKLNCAGQDCPEREGCRRFEVRVPDRYEKGADGLKVSLFEWGGFDIERKRFGGCASRAVIVYDRSTQRSERSLRP